MIKYSKFQPTVFDCKSLNIDSEIDNIQEWLVAPVTLNRDSDLLQSCNYTIQGELLLKIDPDMVNHEVHRIGH